jgi:hypothetical protein
MRSTKILLTMAAITFCASTALAAADRPAAGTQSKAAASLPGKKGQPAQPQASITISCPDGKKFYLTTGTSGGTCTVLNDPNNGAVLGGECGGGGNYSQTACNGGCQQTSGSGGCSPTN